MGKNEQRANAFHYPGSCFLMLKKIIGRAIASKLLNPTSPQKNNGPFRNKKSGGHAPSFPWGLRLDYTGGGGEAHQ